jgi:citrate lyase beta subunit
MTRARAALYDVPKAGARITRQDGRYPETFTVGHESSAAMKMMHVPHFPAPDLAEAPIAPHDPWAGATAGALDLGATLYVPVLHPAAAEIVAGRRMPALRSVVICLEDSLLASDVDRGLAALRALLAGVARDVGGAGAGAAAGSALGPLPLRAPNRRGCVRGPLVFVRPRSVEMARQIACLPGIEMADGFVAPKIGIETLDAWWAVAAVADLRLMPTLEQPWVFDPVRLSAFAAALDGLDPARLIALRMGGNDLLGALGLRRRRGRTIYDGPLAAVLAQAMCQLGARGHALTAPVFDILDDPATLAQETRRDVEFGFIGKTAIHPGQIALIEAAFAVRPDDLAMAARILAPDAPAVFRVGGAMAEPATHRVWAAGVLARARSYGVAPPEASFGASSEAPFEAPFEVSPEASPEAWSAHESVAR